MSLSKFPYAPTDGATIPADALAKTSFGVIADLSEIFVEFEYQRTHILPNNGGCAPDPAGWYFISSEHKTISTWGAGPGRTPGLYVRPTDAARDTIRARCYGRDDMAHGEMGGFKIIPWPNTGHALIVANDVLHICMPFVAFIPLDALPIINATNTPTRK